MSNCDKFISLFSDYLDGSLDGVKKESFEQHLLQCRSCAETVQRMRELKSRLKQLPKIRTSDTFHVVLESRIRREMQRETVLERAARIFPYRRVPMYSAIAAAAALVLFLSYSFFYHSTEMTVSPRAGDQQQTYTVTQPQQANLNQNEQLYFVLEEMPAENLLNINDRSTTDKTRLDRLDSFSDSLTQQNHMPVKIFRAAHATSVTF